MSLAAQVVRNLNLQLCIWMEEVQLGYYTMCKRLLLKQP